MIDATAAALDVEIDAALRRAAKSRDELRRRAAAASERTRQRQTLARAEALAPHFRAEILRRARELQRARVRMLGTLRGLSTAVSTNTSTGAVLSALDTFVRAEESAAWWPLVLPVASRWGAIRRAARDGDEADTDAAVASALVPVENEENEEEEEEEKEKDVPRLRVACVCSMAQFACGAEVTAGNGSPSDSGGGTWGRREEAEKKERERRDLRVDEETDSEPADGPGTDGELIRAVLQAATAHIDALDAVAEEAEEEKAEEEAAEEDDAFDSAMEEARLRLSLELAARAVACRHAVESLAAGEDRNLFDGIAMVGAAPALALPAMEQFFYCAAYTVGAAIARDEANERQNRVDVDDEGTARSKEVANNTLDNQGGHCGTVGWRGVMGRWVSAGLPMGPRLLRYLLEFVIRPYDGERDSEVRVAPAVVRAWLTAVMQEEKDVGAAVDDVMGVFMREG